MTYFISTEGVLYNKYVEDKILKKKKSFATNSNTTEGDYLFMV